MTAKRFRVHEWVKYNYSEIGEYTDENHTDNPLRNDEVVELLNELAKENEQLQQRNKRLEEKIQRERTSFTKTHERWSKEAKTKIKELSEENDKLKKALWCIRKRYGYTVEEFVEDLKDNGIDLTKVDLE